MILIVEKPQQLERPSQSTREHECSLQITLRRMGFYAARPSSPHRPHASRPLPGAPIRWRHDGG